MIAYVNGSFVSEEDAKISVFDRGVLAGDAVFDTTRTFGTRIFRLEDHLARLARSLKYAELDADVALSEVRDATLELVERSRSYIEAEGDVWISQIVTRGELDAMDFGTLLGAKPTVIVILRRINFASFGGLYDSGGVALTSSLLVGHFAGTLDPRVKSVSRLAAARAELAAIRYGRLVSGYAKAVILNQDGSIAEASGANLCIVKDGRLVHPPRHEALRGISLETVCELAQAVGLEVIEAKLTVYDLLDADETLITSTSFSVLPVTSIDGIPLPGRGPIYARLVERWVALVEFDFVTQARERASSAADGATPSLEVRHG
jgi:branched-chain amino acid aminotransferase